LDRLFQAFCCSCFHLFCFAPFRKKPKPPTNKQQQSVSQSFLLPTRLSWHFVATFKPFLAHLGSKGLCSLSPRSLFPIASRLEAIPSPSRAHRPRRPFSPCSRGLQTASPSPQLALPRQAIVSRGWLLQRSHRSGFEPRPCDLSSNPPSDPLASPRSIAQRPHRHPTHASSHR
jgi:hypothetical protein